MKTISLDTSGKNVGIVTWIDGVYHSHELLEFPKKQVRGRKYLQLLSKLTLLAPDMILYEQPVWAHGERRKVMAGMETIIEMYAASQDIETKSIHNMTLKKDYTGMGNITKECMMHIANLDGAKMGFNTDSFDVADAFAVGYLLLKERI